MEAPEAALQEGMIWEPKYVERKKYGVKYEVPLKDLRGWLRAHINNGGVNSSQDLVSTTYHMLETILKYQMKCVGLSNYQYHVQVELRYMILYLYFEYRKKLLVTIYARTVVPGP